jgi:hypothetical protein
MEVPMRSVKQLLGSTAVAAGVALALALGTTQLATAQGEKKGDQKKAEGKKAAGEHSMTGCLQKGSTPTTWTLANTDSKGPKTVEILEVASGVNLAPHAGHKVTITGTTISTAAAAKKEKEPAKKEAGEHHMAVTAVKMVSATCP